MNTVFFNNKATVISLIAVLFLYSTGFCNENEAKTLCNSARLQQSVNYLCSTKKPRNFKNYKILDEVAKYIQTSLDTFGISSEEQIFEYDSTEYRNIICRYGNDSLPKIVIGAHYDVCGDQPGADDNASGVAGLLELAGILSEQKPELKYCIEMVFYTLEEPPFFRTEYMGSYIHAKSLADKKAKVKFMASMEMIGYFSDERGSQKYPVRLLKLFYPSKGNYIAVVGKPGMKKPVKKFKRSIKKSGMKAKKLIAPAKLAGVDFSDHLNYWLFDFKAFMITDTAFMRNFNYHEKEDTPEKLDYVRMGKVVDGIYYSIVNY